MYIYIIFICMCIYIYVYISCHITRSTAFRWPCVFFDAWEVADDIGCTRASRILCSFLCKACQCLFYRQQNEKNYVAYTKLAFLWILHSPQLLGFHTVSSVLCSQQRFKFFQEPFRTWILQGSSPAPHEHILSHGRVQSGMPTLFALQNHVSW